MATRDFGNEVGTLRLLAATSWTPKSSLSPERSAGVAALMARGEVDEGEINGAKVVYLTNKGRGRLEIENEQPVGWRGKLNDLKWRKNWLAGQKAMLDNELQKLQEMQERLLAQKAQIEVDEQKVWQEMEPMACAASLLRENGDQQ